MTEAVDKQKFNLTITELVEKVLSFSIQHHSSCTFYRIPDTERVIFIISKETELKPDLSYLENSPSGFVMAPFSAEQAPILIRADISGSFLQNEVEVYENPDFSFSGIIKNNTEALTLKLPPFRADNKIVPNKNDYLTAVHTAIKEIQNHKLKKVVLARSKWIGKNGIDVGAVFQGVLDKFPYSFVSLSFHPYYGVWLGASPEVLVSLDKNRVFKTMALAGTQKLGPNMSVADAVWRQKEIEEQALVSRYVINCFKTIRLRDYEEEGPRTSMAGDLLHLKTTFSVNTEKVDFNNLTSQMLQLLHPTSAIGGMPRNEALDFIRNHEKLDRSLFAGFLGPVNVLGELNLYVNIRCAQLFNDGALLYAGAGITAESDPEKEYQETEMKMETLHELINK